MVDPQDTQTDTEIVRIGGRIPSELWRKVLQLGYTSQTDAIKAGLTLLVEQTEGRQTQTNDDKVRLAVWQTKCAELQRHNSTLLTALEASERDKEDLKKAHYDYTQLAENLIKQKALETPEKKKWWRRWF